jgi:hypothetical protein
MTDTQTLLTEMYSDFNQRNVEAVSTHMTDNVSWPKASEGGRVVGKDEIRAYWTRQWQDFDPIVEPIEITDSGAGKVDVRVHQLVKSLTGEILTDSEVVHVYTIANGLIERMDLGETGAASDQSPSSAFAHH